MLHPDSLPRRQFDCQLAGALQIQLKRMVGDPRRPLPQARDPIGAFILRRCPMLDIEVLKFGSSVLRTASDLPIAVDEIYRRWRGGHRVLAVVSAFEGVTDQLIKDAAELFGSDCPEATAAYIATGEQRTAALLTGMLGRSGIPARLIEPREISLLAHGSVLESTPFRFDVSALEALWRIAPILILPGFYGIDAQGRVALFGRGGSDLSALFLAAQLHAGCRLLKDVKGVFDSDPCSNPDASRFTELTWETALEVAGPLIQPKALRYAHSRALPFEVSRPNEHAGTRVGQAQNEWAAITAPAVPLQVVLLGCGVVGRGVYDQLQRYRDVFEIRHVVVNDLAKYPDIPERTTDYSRVLDDTIDIVIECFGGVGLSYRLIAAALMAGKYVVTANKAVMAEHWGELFTYAGAPKPRLWFSAAVGGALPALETLERLAATNSSVREIRGIVNGTCGVILDARGEGKTLHEAVALAQAGGFAEADPARDLSGRDSADKLALMIEAAFAHWLPPNHIHTRGIDSIVGDAKGYKLIARARRTPDAIVASVAPESPSPDSFLGQARGAENRIEIELTSGKVIEIRGQGAGRWPTAAAVLADLHEVARRAQIAGCVASEHAQQHLPQQSLSAIDHAG
jgi:homoserine dehydrogenase